MNELNNCNIGVVLKVNYWHLLIGVERMGIGKKFQNAIFV